MREFCPVPFTQLYINPNGDVSVCCDFGEVLGNIKVNSLDDIWNSEKLENIRNQFRDKNLSGPCSKKMELLGCHQKYKHIESFLNEHEKTPRPTSYDCTLNTDCGINCIMCIVKDAKCLDDAESVFLEFTNNGEGIKHISLKSGEPFAQKKTLELVRAIHQKNPDCFFSFTTSANFKLTQSLKELLALIKIHSIHVSLDSLKPDVYRNIRPNGDFETVFSNLDYFLKLKLSKNNSKMDVHINMTVQKKNWKEFFDIYKFCDRKKMILSPLFVFTPLEYSLLSCPQEEIDEVVKQLICWARNYPEMYLYIKDVASPLIDKASLRLQAEFKMERALLMTEAKKTLERESLYKMQGEMPCHLPFTHLEIFPEGRVQTCCWLEKFHIGNIHDDEFESIWNSPKLISLRKEFISKNIHTCHDQVKSRRCHINNVRFNLQPRPSKYPVSLGLNIGHQCNLHCVMCGVVDNRDDERFATLDWAYKNQEMLSSVESIALKGGEPFVQERAYALIDFICSINPKCAWTIYTNGNHQYAGRIQETIQKIDLKLLSISIDSMNPETFSSIRRGGKLPLVTQFVRDISRDIAHKASRGIISAAIWPKNIFDIEGIINFASEIGFFTELIPITFPEQFSFAHCSCDELERYGMYVESLKEKFIHVNFEPIIQTIRFNSLSKN